HVLLFLTPSSPTHFYTLSLHDALPIYIDFADFAARKSTTNFLLDTLSSSIPNHTTVVATHIVNNRLVETVATNTHRIGINDTVQDRKSTRLNSSHVKISYAVFCLKKKK